MSNQTTKATIESTSIITGPRKVSTKTDRKELFWLKGKRVELDVYRIPTKFLYFNIENGRYADKMIQLKSDNEGVEIDPRESTWKSKIWEMLKGVYVGTEGDKEPFQKLREDIKAKLQLRPGVVLYDGGVLDGNRRLAVLLDLAETEQNPSRFEYFEGVILPKDVDEKDRWRIEAGLQIRRDEKLAYSPINQLLKIKEGLELFKGSKNPEREIAKVLYGVPEKDIKKDIIKIRLIDEYLTFIRKPKAYNEVSGLIERFEEVMNALESAKKLNWSPDKIQKLKLTLWAVLRDGIMTNWEMRDIWRAMGASGKGKSAKLKNEKALNEFLDIGCSVKELQEALATNATQSPRASLHEEKAESFLKRMEAFKDINKPLSLADRAKTNLETLLSALENGSIIYRKDPENKLRDLPRLLQEILKIADRCLYQLKKLPKR